MTYAKSQKTRMGNKWLPAYPFYKFIMDSESADRQIVENFRR